MGTVIDVIRSSQLKEIREQVESFCEDIMAGYLDECAAMCNEVPLLSNNTKNFYDSVWGTIEINEGEVQILNSPILQRLRNIKQLGLAHLLYASADHSRFSHTLGVLQTAEVMQKQIEKELDKKDVLTDGNLNQLIRLAAIFHDCGHMFCSHASERYFQGDDSFRLYNTVNQARLYICSRIDIKPSLSELISVFIVQSPSVSKLLSIVRSGLSFSRNENKDTEIEKICCFIWGYPYSEKLLPYSQIISGQIDADKLDYLKRDSHSTGVPAAVDMSRIFQKLKVVETDKKFNMKSTDAEDAATRYTIAIAPAAMNTVDQLMISRYMMFENVYFHQKTLTAECMLRYAIKLLCTSTDGLDNFKNIMKLLDNDVIHADFKSIFFDIFPDASIKDKDSFDKACEILGCLSRRKLFKRSVAFTSDNLVDVGHKGLEFYSKVFKDKSISEQNKFVEKVRTKVIETKRLLSESTFYSNEDTDLLLIVTPDISYANINSNLAIAGKDRRYRDMEFEADNWLKSRSSRKPQNYIVTYPEDRFIVYVCTEYILFTEYGLLITDSIIYEKQDHMHINEIKKYLEQKGYYNNAYAIAPEEETKKYNRALESIVNEKWNHYEMISADNGFAKQMDTEYLMTFIKQFRQMIGNQDDYPLFVKEFVEMLECVKIISKEEIYIKLSRNIDHIVRTAKIDFDMLQLCIVGNVQDGSAQIAYYVNSINELYKKKNKVQQLEQILSSSDKPQTIVFIEDAFCSGKQILSIFETYMGVPAAERQTGEEHVKELSAENKERLKKSKIYFSFILYNADNEQFFLNRMAEIGLSNVEIVAEEHFPAKYFEQEKSDESCEILKKYLTAAGEMLTRDRATDNDGHLRSSWSEKRIKDSCLGYNDAQQLIVFAWNTPTYTMTPLWMKGRVNGTEWIPLFPRTDK